MLHLYGDMQFIWIHSNSVFCPHFLGHVVCADNKRLGVLLNQVWTQIALFDHRCRRLITERFCLIMTVQLVTNLRQRSVLNVRKLLVSGGSKHRFKYQRYQHNSFMPFGFQAVKFKAYRALSTKQLDIQKTKLQYACLHRYIFWLLACYLKIYWSVLKQDCRHIKQMRTQ